MVNRGAVIVKYKGPFIQWINDADPSEDKPAITIQNANQERTVYLISDDDAENIEEWIRANHITPFENELEGWYTDEALWPENRDYKTFMEWCQVECHSLVIDTVGGKIYDDEI
jgi:hypothetical protein